MFLAVRYRNVSACPGASADPLLEALAPGDPTNSSASDDNQDEVGSTRYESLATAQAGDELVS